MKRHIAFYAAAAVVIIAIGCLYLVDRKSPYSLVAGFGRGGVVSSADIRAAVRGNSAFALDLYQQLGKSEGNLFFSPYSLSTALAMVYAGARGETQQQMADVLHFPLEQEKLHPAFAELQAGLDRSQRADHFTLYVASTLWPQQGYDFLDEYLRLIQTCYGVSITPVDFNDREQACDRINRWVEEKTVHKIKDLVAAGALDNLTRLVLANAIYFKGNWQDPFNRHYTQPAPFYVTPSASVRTPMMTQTRKTRYAQLKGLQVLELPYVGNHLSLLVFLPDKIDGLKDLEASLTVDNLTKWRGQLRKTKVVIFLPQVTMTRQFQLADTLCAMGMSDAFSDFSANLAGMTSQEPLCIGAVIHKAYLELNEEGTEAAAATAITGRPASRGGHAPKPLPVFRADHPFVFLIQESRTGSIFFIGRVTDPTKP
jgi:serpin B